MSDERLLHLVREARRRLEEELSRRTEPLAIVGMACRFPGAPGIEAFWRLLEQGSDATGEIPADRFDVDRFYQADVNAEGAMYVRRGGFLGDVAGFEPEIFGLTPREAEGMDPQHRLLLEVAWEAFEDAGLAPDTLAGSRTGVFVGLCFDDYARRSVTSGTTERIDAYAALGNSRSVAAGRLSYVFGLRGPAMQIDTSCSSSLVALHSAAHSLRSGECRMALAGGVNVIAAPEPFIAFSRLRALSVDGRCRTFDASAGGYARGEGCGIVVLKRLADALADGDRIHALVRGTAVNHDGRSNGLTAPNGAAQAEVIAEALRHAGLQAGDVSYVEAHGTGTPLGDPIELLALARAYPAPLVVGSVKTNIGHLEGAAGIAGLIKAALAVSRGRIPAHLHLQTPNPRVPWHQLSLTIPRQTMDWPSGGTRRAGVSSFGMSGTNAHAIVEQPPAAGEPQGTPPALLIALSARTRESLREMARAHADAVAENAAAADVCHTANVARARFDERLAVAAAGAAQMNERLMAFAGQRKARGVHAGRAPKAGARRIAFLFSGQGSQYAGMGRGLYESSAVFRDALDRCIASTGVELRDVIFGTADPDRIHETRWTQPALVAVEYALAEVWSAWGVRPDAVLGHSAGEFTAAAVAGVISIEEALALVQARGQAMQRHMPDGAMAVVLAAADATRELIARAPEPVTIASINSPRHTVISGSPGAIARFVSFAGDGGVDVRRLRTNRAFHSADVDAACADIAAAAAHIRPAAPRVPVVENVSGRLAGPLFGSAGYWTEQARSPVMFAEGLETLREQGCGVFVEIGPAPVLLPMAAAALGPDVHLVPSLQQGDEDVLRLLESAGMLFCAGVDVDLRAVNGGGRRRVTAPGYSFARRRFWTDWNGTTVTGTSAVEPAASLGDRVRRAGPSERASLLETFLQMQLARLSGARSEDLGPETNIHDLGIDSLMLVELDRLVRTELGIDTPIQALARGTIATMIEALCVRIAGGHQPAVFDLSAEARLPGDIAPAASPSPAREASQVLLTGATGFLGAFLLAELLEQTAAHVHCLVRARDEAEGAARVRENLARYGLAARLDASRVSVIPGDLERPRLGLEPAAFARLAELIDVIYNNAAHVSYVSTYDELRRSHVGGTLELLRLACGGRRTTFHHVSSVAVFEAAEYRGQRIDETRIPESCDRIHLAYSQCKWASEALVREAAGRGLDVRIYRPSLISGAAATGAWNTSDFLCRMLKGIVEHGSFPDDLDLLLDFSPVDYVSRAIVHLGRHRHGLPACHLNHPRPLHWSGLAAILRELRFAVVPVPFSDWVDGVAGRPDGVLYPLVPFFRQRWQPDGRTYIELNQRGLRAELTNERTGQVLAAAGISCPPLDRALFSRYFAHLASIGYVRTENTR